MSVFASWPPEKIQGISLLHVGMVDVSNALMNEYVECQVDIFVCSFAFVFQTKASGIFRNFFSFNFSAH